MEDYVLQVKERKTYKMPKKEDKITRFGKGIYRGAKTEKVHHKAKGALKAGYATGKYGRKGARGAGKVTMATARGSGKVGRAIIGESRFGSQKRTGYYEEVTKKGKKKLVKKKRRTGFEGAGSASFGAGKDTRSLMSKAFK